jgi:hypothetical protein
MVSECDLILTSVVKLIFANSVSCIVTRIRIKLSIYQTTDISRTSHTHTNTHALHTKENMITELCLGFEITVAFRNNG